MSRGASGRSESTSSGCPSPARMPKTDSSSSRRSDSPYWGDLWRTSDLPLSRSRHTRPSSWDDSDDEPSPKSIQFNCPKSQIYSSDSAKSKDSVLSEINDLKKHFFRSLETERNSFLEAFEQTPRTSVNEEDRRQSPARVRRRSKSSANSSATQELMNRLIELEEYKLKTDLKSEEEFQINLHTEKEQKKNSVTKKESEMDPKVLLQNFFCDLRTKRNSSLVENSDGKSDDARQQNNNVEYFQDVGSNNDNFCRAYRKLSKILEIEEIKKEHEEKENKKTEKNVTTEERDEFKNNTSTFQVLTLVNSEKYKPVSDLHKSLSLEEVRHSKTSEILEKFPDRFRYSDNEDIISLTAKLGKTEIGLKSGSRWLNNNLFQFYPLKEPELEEQEIVKEMKNFHEVLKIDLGNRSLNPTPGNEHQESCRSLQSSERTGSAKSKEFFRETESPTFKINLDSTRSNKEEGKVGKDGERNKRSLDSSSRTSRTKTDSSVASPGSSKNFTEMTVLLFPLENSNSSVSRKSSMDSSKPSNTPLEQNRETWSPIDDMEMVPSDSTSPFHQELQDNNINSNSMKSTRSAISFDCSQITQITEDLKKSKIRKECDKSEKKSFSEPEAEKRSSNSTDRSFNPGILKHTTIVTSFDSKAGNSDSVSPKNSTLIKCPPVVTIDTPKRNSQKSSSRSNPKSEPFPDSYRSSQSESTTPKNFCIPLDFLVEAEREKNNESGQNSSERNSRSISNTSESPHKSNSSSRRSTNEKRGYAKLESPQSKNDVKERQKTAESVSSRTTISGRSEAKVTRERRAQSTTSSENPDSFRSTKSKELEEKQNFGNSKEEEKEEHFLTAKRSEDEGGNFVTSGRSMTSEIEEKRKPEFLHSKTDQGLDFHLNENFACFEEKDANRIFDSEKIKNRKVSSARFAVTDEVSSEKSVDESARREVMDSQEGTWTKLIETFDGNQKPPIGFPMRRNFSSNSEILDEFGIEEEEGDETTVISKKLDDLELELIKREAEFSGRQNSIKESKNLWSKKNHEDPAPPHSQIFYFEVDKGEKFGMGEFGDVTCWTVDKPKLHEEETPKDHGDGTNLGTTKWGILMTNTEEVKNGKDMMEIRMEDFTKPSSKWNEYRKEDNMVETFYTLNSLKMSKSDNCLNLRQKLDRVGQLYSKTQEENNESGGSTENREVEWGSKSSLEENTENESTESEMEMNSPKVDVLHKRISRSSLILGNKKSSESTEDSEKEAEKEKPTTDLEIFLAEKKKGRTMLKTKTNRWLVMKNRGETKKRKSRGVRFGLLRESSNEGQILPRHSSSITHLKLRNGCLKNFYKRIISVFCLTTDSSGATSK